MSNGTKVFSTGEALRFGWEKTKANLKPLLIIGAVGAFLALLNQALTGPDGDPGLRSLLAILVQVLQVGVTLAFVRAALLLHDGKPLDVSKPSLLLSDFFSFLLTAVLYGLIVAIGLALLIVPGIIWGLKFGFCGFNVVDRRLDPIEALRASSRLTDGIKGELFLFALVLMLVNLIGALALGVGLLVTVPTTFLAAAFVFRRLQQRALTKEQAAAAALPTQTPAPSHP